MKKYSLDVKGTNVPLKELTYSDLIWLFREYINKTGAVPTQKECTTQNNLPHGRIIKHILNEANVTYNDFLNQFGKVKHVRTESKDYDLYLKRYKEVSLNIGHGITSAELMNNNYGLPSANWFVKYCPDDTIKSFDDFVAWAGFHSNKLKKDKDYVIKQLLELEKRLGRPIVKSDITMDNVGFSIIVICRLWGTLSKCKEELGLLKTLPNQPKPFSYYKMKIDDFIAQNNITEKGFVTWKEIEDGTETNHKTLIKAFNDNGNSIYKYLACKHISLNPNSFGYSTILPSGEKIVSSLEYTFSNYLESQGYKYNKDYRRDVLYTDFLPYKKSKMNCDYVFDNSFYVEIAGLINNKDEQWDQIQYSSKQAREYQQKMIIKRGLLEANNKSYLFLFPEDFENDLYKYKFNKLIKKEVSTWESQQNIVMK